MRVVLAGKGNTGKAHLAESGATQTLCKREVATDLAGEIPADRRCKRCVSGGTVDMWAPAAPIVAATSVPRTRPAADGPSLADLPLSFDAVQSLGLDGTGRDCDPRAPYRWSNLLPVERERLPRRDDTGRCTLCAEEIGDPHKLGCPLGDE